MPFDDLASEAKIFLRQKEVLVRSIGFQKGVDRFPALRSQAYESRRPGEVPDCKPWRLNLTRLSHVYNFYYIAYVDKIYVYEPSYPTQQLPQSPVLILSPPVSANATAGYMDIRNPHAINHLVVDFLGDLEVVVVACDDGDVVAYFANTIRAAVDRRQASDGPESANATEVKPVISYNVGMSAWGLSVHSKARKIAVSANTHRITVMSLGLCESDISISDRRLDKYTVIAGMDNNIPTVSFCNTEDDPDGRFLLNGEITGHVYVTDLQTEKRIEAHFVGYCRTREENELDCSCPDRSRYPHGVWWTVYVDWRSFRSISGYVPDSSNEEYRKHWDGSLMKSYVPDSRSTYKLQKPQSRDDSDEEEDTDEEDDDAFSWDAEVAIDAPVIAVDNQRSIATHPWLATEQQVLRQFPRSKRFQHRVFAEPSELEPPCPILVATNSHISLQQPSTRSPVIAFNDPLQQTLQADGVTVPAFGFDRMSLHALIPELGALIVGSPTGRVAIFSLLRTGDWSSKPEGIYFMRLDWLLPLASQEDTGQRPQTSLVGLTAGPVQGQLGAMKPEVVRQWRLMLYYMDHSVLSYEIRLPDGSA